MAEKSKRTKEKLEKIDRDYQELFRTPGADEAKEVHEFCYTTSGKDAEKYINCAEPKLKKTKEKYNL